MAKVLLEKIIPTWGAPLELHSDLGTHFTGRVLQQVCPVWLVLQQFPCTYHPQSSGLVECTKSIIKAQMAKFVETLQIPWPKALPLVLLNLRSTSFGTHKLSSFEIVTGHPVHLTPVSFDPQLIKGDIIQYYKGLNASIKNNHVLGPARWHSS